MADEIDAEVQAISTLINVLKPLDPNAQIHILEFVLKRLNIKLPSEGFASPTSSSATEQTIGRSAVSPSVKTIVTDIRSLAAEKNPQTVNEKVALVAFYISHLAPDGERRDHMTPDDIKTYFVQANFELPTAPPSVTLAHAKNAGYLNALERGQYRLNSVGHNLVAHKLPKREGVARRSATRKPIRNKKK